MHEPCLPEHPNLIHDVDYDGRKVRVSIWYGVNTGPKDTGFEIIRDIGLDPGVRGFPVLKAQVDSTGHGYANVFGWIQGIAHLRPDGSSEDWSPDSIPALRDRGLPFCVLGYHPTFFDAPFWPERPQLYWQADLFLCPIVVRRPSEEEIVPVAGFRWGFKIAKDGGEPELLPLETVRREAWNKSIARLEFWFPSWRFAAWPNREPPSVAREGSRVA